jgi:hypothetical protein
MTVQLRVAQVFPYARVVGTLLAEPSRLGQCWRSGVCEPERGDLGIQEGLVKKSLHEMLPRAPPSKPG